MLYEMLSGQLYMAEKDLEHSHLHAAASHEHHENNSRAFGMCTTHVFVHTYVSRRRARRRKDESKAWNCIQEMKQREAGFMAQPGATPGVPDIWQAARRTMCIAMTCGPHGGTYVPDSTSTDIRT